MNIFTKHSLLHYGVHGIIALTFLVTIPLSEGILPKETTFGSNLIFGNPEVKTTGTVYEKLSFEERKVQKEGHFFQGQTLRSNEKSAFDIQFSDFTIVRSNHNTELSIQNSKSPEIELSKGEIWISTKEHVITHLDNSQVETLGGSSAIKIEDGNIQVVAWEKPSRIIFFSPEGETLWQFLLPSQHQVSFSPNLFFTPEEFKKFRFSKLKKEFFIQKTNSTDFIDQNIGKDANWNYSVLRGIQNKKSKFFNRIVQASLFAILPKKQEEIELLNSRNSIQQVWESIHQKNFQQLETRLADLSPERKLNFYKYAGFYSTNESANNLFIKSFSQDIPPIWKQVWQLESMMFSGTDNRKQNALRERILKEMESSKYDAEEIQFFALSLFNNYPEKINYAIIDFFYDINTLLINQETSPQEKIKRKLEIIQDVFSFTDSLIQKKEYRIARKILDTVELYIKDDESALLLTKKSEILEQKNYIRAKVEYAEILGNEDRTDFNSYVAIKEQVQTNKENEPLYGSAGIDPYGLESVRKLFADNDIEDGNITTNESTPLLFSFEKAKNKNNVVFSGKFNIDNKSFLDIIFYNSKNEEVSLARNYLFSLQDIKEMKQETIERNSENAEIDIALNDEKEEEEKNLVPSEIADFVYTISQNDFIEQDIMATAKSIEILSINTAVIKGAIPHYSEIQQQEERKEKVRKASYKGIDTFLVNKSLEIYDEYTLDFTYNIESKKVSLLTAYAYEEQMSISEELSLEQAIEKTDAFAMVLRTQKETIKNTQDELKDIGISVQIENLTFINDTKILITNAKEKRTRVLFNGEYNPQRKNFYTISLLNIAETPITTNQITTLKEMEEDFKEQSEVFKEKVKEFQKINKTE